MKYIFYIFQILFVFCFFSAVTWIIFKKYEEKLGHAWNKGGKYIFYGFQVLFVLCVIVVFIKGGNFGRRKIGSVLRRSEKLINEIIPAQKAPALINSFETDEDMGFFECSEGASSRLSDLHATDGKQSLKLSVPSGGKFPGMGWEVSNKRQCYDWSDSRHLIVDLYNESDQPVDITLKIKSGAAYPKKSAEVSTRILPAEKFTWEVDLGFLKNKGLDLSAISYIKFWVPHPKREYDIYFDFMRLNKDSAEQASGIPAAKKANEKKGNHLIQGFEDESYQDIFTLREGVYGEVTSEFFSEGTKSILLDIPQGSSNPGIFWEVFGSRFCMDWKGYEYLAVDCYNDSSHSIDIMVKLKSNAQYPKKTYQKSFQISSQQNSTMVVNFQELLKAGFDLSSISYINIFLPNNSKDTKIYFDNFRVIEQYPEKSAWKKTQVQEEEPLQMTQDSPDVSIDLPSVDYKIKAYHGLKKIRREAKYLPKDMTDAINISLARNEYEGGQVIIYGQEDVLKDVYIRSSDLIGPEGAIIGKENIKCNFIGYVQTIKPYYEVDYVGLWPDPLLEDDVLSAIPKDVNQPVWVSVYCPNGKAAGDYHGVITVNGKNIDEKKIAIKVKVWDFDLPKKGQLKTAFDFYPFVSRYYTREKEEPLENWKKRLDDIEEKYYEDMCRHRMSPILNIVPTDADFSSRIKKYFDLGLTAFGIGEYGGSFGNKWPSDPKEIHKKFHQYAGILEDNGWLDEAYIYTYDEPQYGDSRVSDLCSMIHQASPGLNNMVCIRNEFSPSKQPEWGKDIDIWCVHVSRYDQKEADFVKNRGQEVWLYISGPDSEFPGVAIDYSLLRTRITPWMCWKYDASGYLYWAVNYWQRNPWKTTEATPWSQNGNGTLYYPGKDGPVGTIRLEAVRDGIEDYEYLGVLKEKLQLLRSSGKGLQSKSLIDQTRAVLEIDPEVAKAMNKFTKSPERLLLERNNIALLIEKINNVL